MGQSKPRKKKRRRIGRFERAARTARTNAKSSGAWLSVQGMLDAAIRTGRELDEWGPVDKGQASLFASVRRDFHKALADAARLTAQADTGGGEGDEALSLVRKAVKAVGDDGDGVGGT